MLNEQSLDLTEPGSESKTFDLSWPPDEVGGLGERPSEDGLEIVSPVTGAVTITPDPAAGKGRFAVSGRIETEVAFLCARCLEPGREPIELEFELALVPQPAPSQGERELETEELDQEFIVGERLDLVELIKEQILLSRPMINLCREDCRGLCPTCGANHNQGGCDCPENEVDPRLAALANFKAGSGDKEN